MSETYLIEGGSFIGLSPGKNVCQTFRPKEDHDLYYVDLNFKLLPQPRFILVSVYFASAYHTPIGPPISRSELYLFVAKPRLNIYRTRFFMTSHTLYSDSYYALSIFSPYSDDLSQVDIEYDKNDATYIRGMMSTSEDAGETWTPHYNDDLIFAEFGTPPAPKPPPPPPIPNFAILDCVYLYLDNGIIFRVPSNVPCHLICYYTDIEPLKHHRSTIIRGITVPWDTYFCFVGWKVAEQIEPGDTCYHTFAIPNWQKDQTRWFTLRGTVDLQPSPSVGPIFKHKHPGQNLIKNPGFEIWTHPPGQAPDNWEYPPSAPHTNTWPDGIIKVEGNVSCRLDNETLWGNYYIYQALPIFLLSSIKLTFKLQYRGKLSTWNWFRIRAIGDTRFYAYARPTQNYIWETLSITSMMPNNLTTLYLQAQNMNQGDPVPFQTWWDIARIELA